MDELTLTLRLFLAAVLAGLLGLEREWKGQSAGFRTHILVSLGACLFTLVGAYGFLPDHQGMSKEALSVDPTRVSSQIVVGIGFLGGGAILKYKTTVRGLTTAANLWLSAAVGMAVGIGYYFAAVTCVVLSLIVLAGLLPLERKLFPEPGREDDLGEGMPKQQQPEDYLPGMPRQPRPEDVPP